MSTSLSVNRNKIALLRNSRGRDYPNVVDYAQRFIDLGVHGITIHPRQDERHAKKQDARELGELCRGLENVEFNIEGFPSEDFMALILAVKPDQCTLVPDDVNQLTSDHGWDVPNSTSMLGPVLAELRSAGIRSSLFVDPVPDQARAAAGIGADRIELYTEMYANTYGTSENEAVFQSYGDTAAAAQDAGIGVNAGHDLDLSNLDRFLEIPGILEVSIGHALTIECIDSGMREVVGRYLAICRD